jgi:hypothetical protein
MGRSFVGFVGKPGSLGVALVEPPGRALAASHEPRR